MPKAIDMMFYTSYRHWSCYNVFIYYSNIQIFLWTNIQIIFSSMNSDSSSEFRKQLHRGNRYQHCTQHMPGSRTAMVLAMKLHEYSRYVQCKHGCNGRFVQHEWCTVTLTDWIHVHESSTIGQIDTGCVIHWITPKHSCMMAIRLH